MSQPNNNYTQHLADSIIDGGIDTLLYYQPYISPLTHESTECCMIYERNYLLWKIKEHFFILKHYDYYDMDKNIKGKVVQVSEFQDSLQIFQYLFNNFYQVTSDKLRPAKLRYFRENKEIIEDYSKLRVYDDAYTGIRLFVNGKTYENGFMSDYLNDGTVLNADGSFREKKGSLNYDSNKKKAIYKLIIRIEKLVSYF